MPTAKKTTAKGQGTLDSLPVSTVSITKAGKKLYAVSGADEITVWDGTKIKMDPEAKPVDKGGRPSSYTKEIGDEICARITEGQSLRKICRDDHMPSLATIFNWQRSVPGFLEQYTRAKDEQADTNAEDLQEIVEEVRSGKLDPQSARVAADILKWTSSKLKPKKYGDKLDLTSDGKQLPTPIISIAAAPETKEINS